MVPMWRKPICRPSLSFPALRLDSAVMEAASLRALVLAASVVPKVSQLHLVVATKTAHSVRFSLRTQNAALFGVRSSLCSPISPIPNSVNSFLSISASVPFSSKAHFSSFVQSSPNGAHPVWSRSPDVFSGEGAGEFGDKDRAIAVVLLGWLGAKPKHLRRYAEWYNSRGIQAMIFVVEVGEVLWFDLGTRIEQRVMAFGDELGSWVSQKEADGRERCLIFHTFSNTGWLAYGGILQYFKEKEGLMEKIKGVIFDSGSGDALNPQIWAAGFAAAMLKKNSTSVNGLGGEVSASKLSEKDTPIREAMILFLLEKLFTYLLELPKINGRLMKILHILSQHQPSCPQLYLYSAADKIVPSKTIELFMENQRLKGKEVYSFDFGSSPHVDHYRTFPSIYSAELHNFLKQCFVTVMNK